MGVLMERHIDMKDIIVVSKIIICEDGVIEVY